VERVLSSISHPLFRGRWLAEEHSGLAPPESDEPVGRFFENLNLFDSADGFRGVLDVGDCGPDRRPGSVDGDLCFNEHGVHPGVRVTVYCPGETRGILFGAASIRLPDRRVNATRLGVTTPHGRRGVNTRRSIESALTCNQKVA